MAKAPHPVEPRSVDEALSAPVESFVTKPDDGLVPTGWPAPAYQGPMDPQVEPFGPVETVTEPSTVYDDVAAVRESSVDHLAVTPLEADDAVEFDASPEYQAVMGELAELRAMFDSFGQRQDWMVQAITGALGQFQQMMSSGPGGMLGKMLGLSGKAGKGNG
jgi:hypothetical protein